MPFFNKKNMSNIEDMARIRISEFSAKIGFFALWQYHYIYHYQCHTYHYHNPFPKISMFNTINISSTNKSTTCIMRQRE